MLISVLTHFDVAIREISQVELITLAVPWFQQQLILLDAPVFDEPKCLLGTLYKSCIRVPITIQYHTVYVGSSVHERKLVFWRSLSLCVDRSVRLKPGWAPGLGLCPGLPEVVLLSLMLRRTDGDTCCQACCQTGCVDITQ